MNDEVVKMRFIDEASFDGEVVGMHAIEFQWIPQPLHTNVKVENTSFLVFLQYSNEASAVVVLLCPIRPC